MSDELAYALVTPHALAKGRLGGILARLLGATHLEPVAARLYRFSDEFVDRYAAVGAPEGSAAVAEAHLRYLNSRFRPARGGQSPTGLLVLLKGPNAQVHVAHELVGCVSAEPGAKGAAGTIADTFGDLVMDERGAVAHYEPACLTAPTPSANRAHLKLFAEYARKDGGVQEDHVRRRFPKDEPVETTLLMLKPESFRRPSRRAGNILDVFARTGLHLSAARLFGMSPDQADRFYGPLKDMFRERFRPRLADKARELLTEGLKLPITAELADGVAGVLNDLNAETEFRRIASYMTGVDVGAVPAADRGKPGTAKCLALLLTGPSAVSRVRKALGATDPSKAEPGTVRGDYAANIMQNGAHASDSEENCLRERAIIGLSSGPEADPTVVERMVDLHVK